MEIRDSLDEINPVGKTLDELADIVHYMVYKKCGMCPSVITSTEDPMPQFYAEGSEKSPAGRIIKAQCWADTSYSKTNVHTGNQAKLTCAGDFCAKFVYPTGTEWGCPAPGVCTKNGKQIDYTGPIDATGKRATGTMYCCDRELCNSAVSFDAKRLVDCPSMSFCGKLVYEGGVEWGCIEKEAYCVDSKSQLLTMSHDGREVLYTKTKSHSGDEHKIECMTDFCAKSILANSMENIAAWGCGNMLMCTLWTVFEIVIPLLLAAPLVFAYLSAEDKLAPVDYPASPGMSWQLDGMNLTCDDVIYTGQKGVENATMSQVMTGLLTRLGKNKTATYAVDLKTLEKALASNETVAEATCRVGVEFKKLEPKNGHIDYTIWFPKPTDAKWSRKEKWEPTLDKAPPPKYQLTGALGLQYAVDQSLTAYPIIMALLIFPNVVNLARAIASEGEAGLKEYMEVMGLSVTQFYSAHCLMGWLKALPIYVVLCFPIILHLKMVPAILVILTIFVYSWAALSFALMCSSMLKTSSGVFRGTMLLWAVSFMIPSFTDVELDRPFKTYIYSLNLNHALLAAVSVMVGYDQRGKHLGFGELFERGSANFNLASALIMLIIDCVWMHLYAWTVDQSRKAEGTKWFKEWMKEMRGHYHLEGEQVKPEVRKGLVDEVDQVRSSKVADIEVESLTKKYGLTGGYGLIDMNLRATRGQVTVLLGHNGAGKSTAFNVICGKTKPTFGTVHVEGPIGLCPQTNPLFAKLSAREHLWFFHHLKGSSGDWEDEAERLMHDLDFYDAKDELAQNLSGGTKRKLCVAMAVIGDPNVILLDEPTAGMDPGARIAVEKLLQRVKKDRTILLTTHFMDEAEKVGDWVTIIQSGRNILNGSPEYLKKKYGTGYILTVVGSPVVDGVIQDTTARVDYQAVGLSLSLLCIY
ncbi:unnamed protein product, partial [Mesorhabditis spiculigera]